MEQENKTTQTRAEKKDNAKKIIRKVLEEQSYASGALIEAASAVYTETYGGEDVPNDVKGRIGSVIDVMKKEGEIALVKGKYALKTEKANEETKVEKVVTVDKAPKKTVKARKKPTDETKQAEEVNEEKPKKTRAKKAKKVEKVETVETENGEKVQPLPAPPAQPIAPTAPVTPEVAPEPIPEKKKRTRKAKAEPAVAVETPLAPQTVEPAVQTGEVEPAPKTEKVEKVETADTSPKGTLMDMSFLIGVQEKKEPPKRLAPAKEQKQLPSVAESRATAEKPAPKAEKADKADKKTEPKAEVKPAPAQKREVAKVPVRRTPSKPQTADERLQDAFLKRIRRLGGEFFEYYSVYLIEKYSRMSGRRLEGLKISGGEHDGGIDGEIELTDRLGFRETIYIQSKNWDPDKGDERLWVVGETLLQQFIGACACRQARDKKQHARGIFITTSRFTPDAKRILEELADKIVGYDGEDLYETAKECQFGILKKNGEYVLDEALLSGEKAFFFMS